MCFSGAHYSIDRGEVFPVSLWLEWFRNCIYVQFESDIDYLELKAKSRTEADRLFISELGISKQKISVIWNQHCDGKRQERYEIEHAKDRSEVQVTCFNYYEIVEYLTSCCHLECQDENCIFCIRSRLRWVGCVEAEKVEYVSYACQCHSRKAKLIFLWA